jgi:pimeloyl-ACP methyl ester carboxylesterase
MTTELARFFENRRGLRLFGMFHKPDTRQRATGAVFCHPIGDDKTFSYRAYVEFARALVAAGYAVLRYDSGGCGDSEGEFVDATVDTLRDDALDAIAELRLHAGIENVALIGCRFGATVAALAAASDPGISATALVSPVISGSAYRDKLLRAHQMSALTQGRPGGTLESLLKDIAAGGAVEIDGQLVGAWLLTQLAAIDLRRVPAVSAAAAIVTDLESDGPERTSILELVAAYHAAGRDAIEWREPREFWSADSLYAGYVPKNLITRTITWLQERAR